MELITQLDQTVLFWFQGIRTPFFDAVFRGFTVLGNGGVLWLACSIVFLCVRRWRPVGVLSLIAMLLTLLSGEVLLKHLVARPRPFVELEALTTLFPAQTGFSFPSGHTASSFAASGVFVHGAFPRWIKVLFPVLAVLMGVSRLYVGVHYPSDVLAGMLLGLFWSQLVWMGCFVFQRRKAAAHQNEK